MPRRAVVAVARPRSRLPSLSDGAMALRCGGNAQQHLHVCEANMAGSCNEATFERRSAAALRLQRACMAGQGSG